MEKLFKYLTWCVHGGRSVREHPLEEELIKVLLKLRNTSHRTQSSMDECVWRFCRQYGLWERHILETKKKLFWNSFFFSLLIAVKFKMSFKLSIPALAATHLAVTCVRLCIALYV